MDDPLVGDGGPGNRVGGKPRRVAPELYPVTHRYAARRSAGHLRRHRRADPLVFVSEMVLGRHRRKAAGRIPTSSLAYRLIPPPEAPECWMPPVDSPTARW